MRQVIRFLLVFWCVGVALAADLPYVYPQARAIFPEAEGFGGFEGVPQSVAVYQAGKVIGYLFLTEDVIRIPAYSGKPINTMVGLDLQGRIVGLAIVNHDEPILAVGITQDRLQRYTDQYVGKSAFDRVVIGAKREGHLAIDGISGATITVMVQNATVMRAAKAVADSRGIRAPGLGAGAARAEATGAARAPATTTPAAANSPPATPPNATPLAVAPAAIPPATRPAATAPAASIGAADPTASNTALASGGAATLPAQSMGAATAGPESFGPPSPAAASTAGTTATARTNRAATATTLPAAPAVVSAPASATARAEPSAAPGAAAPPPVPQRSPAVIAHTAQSPPPRSTPFSTAPAKPPAAPRMVHGVVPRSPEVPPRVIGPLPERPGTWAPPKEEPAWVAVWQNRAFEIVILAIGLAALSVILVFQDWLARRATLLTYVRYGFHVYTLFFIGWWGLAQLSVVNVLTFVGSVMSGFNWEHFLIDPLLFVLWGFVAVTLLLWGRGVYCGWLCPFGALQELILAGARKLHLPEWEFSDAVHERLVALKYIILILLFGLSLQSISQAAWYAEVEPFKTVITMRFQREWQYVLYALILLGLAAVNRKFYCKYLCPLGAALAIPGRFRLFEWWLRRRKECGKPCQVCANRCSVRAIRATGEINANECHYCLDCQVIYYNDKVCLPLIDRRKRREAQIQRVKAEIAADGASGAVEAATKSEAT